MADFYFDLGSPYAWLAAERLASGRVDLDAEWRPILLGAVFKAVGRSSWARTDRRAAGMAEVERRAAAYGLPHVRWPDPWPGNGLTAMCAGAYARDAGFGRKFALAAFRRAFTEGRDLSLAENVHEAAADCGRRDEVAAALERQEVKDALRAATDEALAAGVIGVPTVAVDGELFWGDDRLDEAALRASRG
jgi:2-hydroxychromene-2-carboxylate isomerase